LEAAARPAKLMVLKTCSDISLNPCSRTTLSGNDDPDILFRPLVFSGWYLYLKCARQLLKKG
ncbi:MAG: hypothetical protein J0G97_08930, partial [Rhizobium pusense]|nr:hypothetical protein [Agrobacterium pusense]